MKTFKSFQDLAKDKGLPVRQPEDKFSLHGMNEASPGAAMNEASPGIIRNESAPLTLEQIAHWRRVLAITIGPFALIMPVEFVQRARDKFQEYLDRTDAQFSNDECNELGVEKDNGD